MDARDGRKRCVNVPCIHTYLGTMVLNWIKHAFGYVTSGALSKLQEAFSVTRNEWNRD